MCEEGTSQAKKILVFFVLHMVNCIYTGLWMKKILLHFTIWCVSFLKVNRPKYEWLQEARMVSFEEEVPTRFSLR